MKSGEGKKVLLLLSGGKDSALALDRLRALGYQIHGLCIDGKQGQEKIGAEKAAQLHGIELEIVQISFFDETTWNPFKLIWRDLAMGIWAIRIAYRHRARFIATGVKKSDIQKPALWWLGPFLLFGKLLFACCGLRLIFPVWRT